MRIFYNLLLILALFLLSCNNSGNENMRVRKPGKQELADINSFMVQKDRERIGNYAERKNLRLQESSSGLWYMITKEGSGRAFRDNDRIIMEYKCSLLDGTPCYSSEKLGPKEIVLGKSELEAGLYEGLKMLKPGGEALFILPPFLAYGIIGDNKAIPPRAVIVYEIKVTDKK
jgi:FKBP-type peptidyl-prolyl cis-trans isomerase FkpA